MASLTANELQEGYAAELSDGALSRCTSPHYLHKELVSMGLKVTEQACKQWWEKFRKPPNAVVISTAKTLQEQYGASIFHLAKDKISAYKLCKRLLERDPPVSVTHGVAKEWLKKYATHQDLTGIQNSGHLEMSYGDRIRAEKPSDITDGAGFQVCF